jgi:hypothetical protein
MNEAEEPTPETGTPDTGSTRDATLGKFMVWTAVGVGVIAAFSAIGKAALIKQREAQLERVVRAGREAARWGLQPGRSTSGPTGQGLYGPGRWAVHETRAELERNWRMDDRR